MAKTKIIITKVKAEIIKGIIALLSVPAGNDGDGTPNPRVAVEGTNPLCTGDSGPAEGEKGGAGAGDCTHCSILGPFPGQGPEQLLLVRPEVAP